MLITRGDERALRAAALRGQLARRDRQHRVAVDHLAVLVDEDGSGRASPSSATPTWARCSLHRCAAGAAGAERAAVAVDVLAVGLDADAS